MNRQEIWISAYQKYCDFIFAMGRIPLRVSDDESECSLAMWMHRNDRRKLSYDQWKQIDVIFPLWRDLASIDRRWLRNFLFLWEYERKFGFPVGVVWVNGVNLTQFLRRQKCDCRTGNLDGVKFFIMNFIPGWRESLPKKPSIDRALWRLRYRVLRKFIRANGMPGTFCVYKNMPIGKWVSRLYQARREGRVPDDVIAAFDDISGWRWSRR